MIRYPKHRNDPEIKTSGKSKETEKKKMKRQDQESNSYIKMIGLLIISAWTAFFVIKMNFTEMVFGKIGKENQQQEQTQQIKEATIKPKEETAETQKQLQEQIYNQNEIPVTIKNETPIIIRSTGIFVKTKIGYKGKEIEVSMLVDTGATGITISPAVARKLEIKEEDTKEGIVTIANGIKTKDYITKAEYVAVGEKRMENIEIRILPRRDNEETGLLGMSFLGEFPHILDIKSHVIKWM